MAELIRIWPQLGEIRRRVSRSRSRSTRNTRSISTARPPMSRPIGATRALELPDELDYAAMTGLSMEVRQKLESIRPRTIGQAGRIDGMTPAALTLLAAHIRRGGKRSPRRLDQAAHDATKPCRTALADDRAQAIALNQDSVSRETWARLDRFVALLLAVAAGHEPGRAVDASPRSGPAMSPTRSSSCRWRRTPGAGSISAPAPAFPAS